MDNGGIALYCTDDAQKWVKQEVGTLCYSGLLNFGGQRRLGDLGPGDSTRYPNPPRATNTVSYYRAASQSGRRLEHYASAQSAVDSDCFIQSKTTRERPADEYSWLCTTYNKRRSDFDRVA